MCVAEDRTTGQGHGVQPRQAGHTAPVFVVDEAGKHLVFAVAQAQHGAGVAGADLVGDRAALGLDLAQDVADLQADLDGHVAIGRHGGFDFELQAHIDVLHGFCHEAGRGGGGGDVGHTLAHLDLGLLAVARADARVRQHVHVRDGAGGLQADGEVTHRRGGRADVLQVSQGELHAAGAGHGRQGHLRGVLHTELQQP